MSRSLSPWIGKTDDAAIPPRVKLRVWDRDNGTCQGPCHRKLGPSDKVHFDHKIPLKDGGPHSEDNLQLMCEGDHIRKTGLEAAARGLTHAIQKRHRGINKPSRLAEKWKWKKRILAERAELERGEP